MSSASSIDAAYGLLVKCQLGDASSYRDDIARGVESSRQSGQSDVEAVWLFVDIIATVAEAGEDILDRVDHMVRRTLEINEPVWHATSLAMSAISNHRGSHVLSRMETLAEAVAILTAHPTPSRALARGLNAVAMAYSADRMWELSQEFFDWTQQVIDEIDDIDMQLGTVINRLSLAVNEIYDLIRLGYFDEAQERARFALEVERPHESAHVAGDELQLIWTHRTLRSILIYPPEPEFDVAAWASLGASRHRTGALITAAMAIHNGDADRAEALLDVVMAHPLPIEEPMADRLGTWVAAQIAQHRIQPAARDGVEAHVRRLSEEIREIRQALGASAEASIETRRQEEETAELRRLSAEDSLTGVANRRAFDAIFDLRRGKQTALLIIDIDRFKAVNDRWGHEVGDEVLRRIGSAITTATRERDTVCRIGGDEFAVVLATAKQSLADRIATRIITEVKTTDWTRIADALTIEVSVGSATAETSQVYGLADKALYEAKRQRRES